MQAGPHRCATVSTSSCGQKCQSSNPLLLLQQQMSRTLARPLPRQSSLRPHRLQSESRTRRRCTRGGACTSGYRCCPRAAIASFVLQPPVRWDGSYGRIRKRSHEPQLAQQGTALWAWFPAGPQVCGLHARQSCAAAWRDLAVAARERLHAGWWHQSLSPTLCELVPATVDCLRRNAT